MIMFCGLPTSVATLPMFALVANAIRYGKSGKRPRTITATTRGVSIRQTESLTSNAESSAEATTR
jgi:hypothetical protein